MHDDWRHLAGGTSFPSISWRYHIQTCMNTVWCSINVHVKECSSSRPLLHYDACAFGRLVIENINGYHLFIGGVPSKACTDLYWCDG